MVQSKPQNQREWLLKLGNEKLNIILEDPSSRDEWVSAIRGAIKSKSQSSSDGLNNEFVKSVTIRTCRTNRLKHILAQYPKQWYHRTFINQLKIQRRMILVLLLILKKSIKFPKILIRKC